MKDCKASAYDEDEEAALENDFGPVDRDRLQLAALLGRAMPEVSNAEIVRHLDAILSGFQQNTISGKDYIVELEQLTYLLDIISYYIADSDEGEIPSKTDGIFFIRLPFTIVKWEKQRIFASQHLALKSPDAASSECTSSAIVGAASSGANANAPPNTGGERSQNPRGHHH